MPVNTTTLRSNSNEIAVHTESLSRTFGSTDDPDHVVAVRDLNLDIRVGEVFGLLGHNGAGKTTTIRLLNGVLAPSAGTRRVLGHDPAEDGPSLRRQTGVLTESPSLDDKLTAEENLTIYGRLYGVEASRLHARVTALLETFDLSSRASQPVGGYSKGMKQRLALARALLHAPRLIFLDEPTAGLDPLAAESVRRLILRLTQEDRRTVILCTHNLVEAQRLCDRVGVLEHGQLVALGTPAALAQDLRQGVRLRIEMDSWDTRALALPDAAEEISWHEEDQVLQLRIPSRSAIPDVVAALVQAGRRIYSVSPEEPTLEDVYFSLHETREASDGLHSR